MAIRYKDDIQSKLVKVILDGKHVGNIMATIDGKYRYFPKGAVVGGAKFDTLQACKQSLEAE